MNYEELIADYKALADNDPAGAFRLMTAASGLIEFYETQKFKWQQDANDQEAHTRWLEAKTALDSNESAAKGSLIAKADVQVRDEWKTFNKMVAMSDNCKTKVNMLVRVYFDCKEIWLKGEKDVNIGRHGGGISKTPDTQGDSVRAGQKGWR